MSDLTVTLKEILGYPLNETESKYAPKSIYYKGPMTLPLSNPRVSVIGSRDASEKELLEAQEITKTLVKSNVTIISGLAKGIDAISHKTAIKYGGKTVAVIGTPLNKFYPKENQDLQNEIMEKHLVISQYPIGHTTTRKDFVLRNKTMAILSNAAVIVAAKDSSGSLHHGRETLRLHRPLFISKYLVKDESLTWPKKMLDYGAISLDDPKDILNYLPTDITSYSIPDILSESILKDT